MLDAVEFTGAGDGGKSAVGTGSKVEREVLQIVRARVDIACVVRSYAIRSQVDSQPRVRVDGVTADPVACAALNVDTIVRVVSD